MGVFFIKYKVKEMLLLVPPSKVKSNIVIAFKSISNLTANGIVPGFSPT